MSDPQVQPVTAEMVKALQALANVMVLVQANPEFGPYATQRLQDAVEQEALAQAHPGAPPLRRNPRRPQLEARRRRTEG
jgi:hypothetical protein